jgi:hypothetical protein
MEGNRPVNPFQEVHKKVRDARDRAQEVREKESTIRQERAEEEAVREGFDRPSSKLLPRLIADGNLRRCSICGYPLPSDVQPSVTVAFADHLLKAHRPG